MQSRRQALLEVLINVGTGAIGASIITWLCLTYVPLGAGKMSILITGLCTIWSIIRGYSVRCYFNARLTNGKRKAAEQS